jgi:ArsR family transcriptional regulator
MDNTLLSREITEMHAGICSALADPKRILILYILAENRLSVGELANELGVPQPTASRHLKYLKERDLVRPYRRGTVVEYHITDKRLIEALDILRSVLCDRISNTARLLQTEEAGIHS